MAHLQLKHTLVLCKSLDLEVCKDVLFLHSFHKNLSLLEAGYQISVAREQQLLWHFCIIRYFLCEDREQGRRIHQYSSVAI